MTPMRIIHSDGPDMPPITVYFTSDGREMKGHGLPVFVISSDYSFVDYYLEVDGFKMDDSELLDFDCMQPDDEGVYAQALKITGLPSLRIIEEWTGRIPCREEAVPYEAGMFD